MTTFKIYLAARIYLEWYLVGYLNRGDHDKDTKELINNLIKKLKHTPNLEISLSDTEIKLLIASLKYE